jgi:Tfp pilus assembly protein PilP
MASTLWLVLLMAVAACMKAQDLHSDIRCNVDITRPACHLLPLPVYIYPFPWHYEPTAMNPYVFHVIRWLRGRKGLYAEAVDDAEVIKSSSFIFGSDSKI